MREAGALTLSLVADADGRILGHVAFSPIRVSDGSTGWYGLGPVSVWPQLHGQGIGSAPINEGLSRLKTLDAQGCALVGEPGYSRRVGFRNHPELVHEGIPQECFLTLPFAERVPAGMAECHEGFQATG